MIELENDIENQFVQEIRARGGDCLKLEDRDGNGFPDRTVLLAGDVWFVEFKKPGGGVKPNQSIRIARLQRLGFKAGIAKSVKQAFLIGGYHNG